jgi:hypothetical protein
LTFDFLAESPQYPGIGHIMQKRSRRVARPCSDLISSAQRTGRLDSNFDPNVAATIFSSVTGLARVVWENAPHLAQAGKGGIIRFVAEDRMLGSISPGPKRR